MERILNKTYGKGDGGSFYIKEGQYTIEELQEMIKIFKKAGEARDKALKQSMREE